MVILDVIDFYFAFGKWIQVCLQNSNRVILLKLNSLSFIYRNQEKQCCYLIPRAKKIINVQGLFRKPVIGYVIKLKHLKAS